MSIRINILSNEVQEDFVNVRTNYQGDTLLPQFSGSSFDPPQIRMAYYYNRRAKTISPRDLEPWRKDLRRMTQIYKSIGTVPEEDRLEVFLEAQELFRTFKNNFEHWVYKEVLPTTHSDKQSILEKDVASKVWTALGNLTGHEMFPSAWDYKSEKHEPAPWKVTPEMQKSISRYQRGMNAALKAIEDYIDARGGMIERRPAVEIHQIGKVNIVIHNEGRDARGDGTDDLIEDELSTLADAIRKIERTGMRAAVAGLTVHMSFDRNDLRAGHYNPSADELMLFPLGMGRENNETLIHEAGHRYYFRAMPPNARDYWDEIIDKQAVEIGSSDIREFIDDFIRPEFERTKILPSPERLKQSTGQIQDAIHRTKMVYLAHHLPGMTDTPDDVEKWMLQSLVGDRINLEFISSYGATNAKEAFAEAFMLWVTKGPRALGPWTRDFFARITRTGGNIKYSYAR